MIYTSTRDPKKTFTLSEAMRKGLSSDGGLIVPCDIPMVDLKCFNTDDPYPDFCAKVLLPYFKGDLLEPSLHDLCQQSFTFNVPLQPLNDNTTVMELFHGPTLSFKDFGARFLAASLSNLATTQPLTIMVATSGDTGSAVASAFHNMPNINVVVLFPYGKVSPRQQAQITCWDHNVQAIAVEGTFDDCQAMVKQALDDSCWPTKTQLCTANSINIGRLLPQICYYAYHSLRIYEDIGYKPGFIVPSGNLGNVTAAFYAKVMGFPIRELVIATNNNRIVPDYLATGVFEPRPSIATLANAMDVGNPSNFERLLTLFDDVNHFKQKMSAFSVNDEQIKQTIIATYECFDYIACPHTATAIAVRSLMDDSQWVVAATADPSKFETVIDGILDRRLGVPPQLQSMINQPHSFLTIEPTMEALKAALTG